MTRLVKKYFVLFRRAFTGCDFLLGGRLYLTTFFCFAVFAHLVHAQESHDYRGQDISNLNFSGQDLSNAQFDENTTFSVGEVGVNLSGTNAKLSGINLTGTDLSYVNFAGLDLSDSNFSGSNFLGANLSGAIVNNTDLSESSLTESNLTDTLYNVFTIWPTDFEFEETSVIRSDDQFFNYLNEVSSVTRTESNQSTQVQVLANPSQYDLYSQTEKLLFSADKNHTSYQAGFLDGSNKVTSIAAENPNSLGLYSEQNKTDAINNSSAIALARIQANLAMNGLSLVSYLMESNETNATQTSHWYYQPELGWVWTTRSAYPYLYKAGGVIENNETIMEGWMFHNQSGPDNYYFYDFGMPGWNDFF